MLNKKDRDSDKRKNIKKKISLQNFLSKFKYFQNRMCKDNISIKTVLFIFYS